MREDDSLTEEEGYVRRVQMKDRSMGYVWISRVEPSDQSQPERYSAMLLFKPNRKWLWGVGPSQRDAVDALVDFHSRYANVYFNNQKAN